VAQGGSDSYSPQKLKGAIVTDSQRFRNIFMKKLAYHLPEIKCYYHSSGSYLKDPLSVCFNMEIQSLFVL
jgi:hypothetical protein